MAPDLRIDVNIVGPSHFTLYCEIAMHQESTIIERVETFVRHPVYPGSDKATDLVLQDLESMVEDRRIHQATYQRLRELILRSPHVARNN